MNKQEIKALLLDVRMCMAANIEYAKECLANHKLYTELETENDKFKAKAIQEDIDHMNKTLTDFKRINLTVQ